MIVLRSSRLAPQRRLARGAGTPIILVGVAVLAILSFPAASSAQSGGPAWVTNLPMWQWYPIPNTALSSVVPSPVPFGGTGPISKIIAWCGATLKRQGSVYLIGAAGGHGDYAGNEVDALQLNTANPAWVQLRGPSPHSEVITGAQYYLDRRPSATHTYWASQFINARNRFFVMPSPGMGTGGIPDPPPGWPYAGDAGYTFSFDMSSNDWDAPEYVARYTGGGDFTGALVAKHPVTENIYYNRASVGWWRWTQATNTWTKVNNNNNSAQNYSAAAIDPIRNRMLLVGSYGGSVPPRVLDLDGNPLSVTFGGLGASALTIGSYPGVVYDEASDRFLVVFNSGSSIRVRRVNPATWFVDEPATTGTPPGSRINGIHNSVQYVPELGGIVIANNYNGNVFFLRTDLTSTPSDNIAPSPPTALQPR